MISKYEDIYLKLVFIRIYIADLEVLLSVLFKDFKLIFHILNFFISYYFDTPLLTNTIP